MNQGCWLKLLIFFGGKEKVQNKKTLVPAAIQILAVGDANVELGFLDLTGVPSFGQEVIVPKFFLRAAGSAANFAICSANLGAKTGFVGCIAVDQFGEVVLKAFRNAEVDTQCLRLVEDYSTGVAVSMSREAGGRAVLTYPGTNAQITLDSVKKCLKKDPPPRWLHLASYHLLNSNQGKPVASILELARSRGATTSLDACWQLGPWTNSTIQTIKTILQFVDVFFLNATVVKALTGEKSTRKGAQRLLEGGASALVIKLGGRGCLLAIKRDQRIVPAFSMNALDTTAASDAFNAGFAVSMLSGATMSRAAIFANAVAALYGSRKANQTLFPTLQETTAFLMRKRPLDT